MKNQTPYLLVLIIAFLAVSCGDGKKSDLSTENVAIHDTLIGEPCVTNSDSFIIDIDSLKNAMKGKRIAPVTITTIWLIHRERWVPRFKTEAATIAHFKVIADNIAEHQKKYGINRVFELVISNPGELPYTANTGQQFVVALVRAAQISRPAFRADELEVISEHRLPGNAIKNGSTVPGMNYAAVGIFPNNTLNGPEQIASAHELWHLLNIDHPHRYIYDGKALDNYGQYYFNVDMPYRNGDDKNPMIKDPGTGLSYSLSAGKQTTPDLHPVQVLILQATLSSKPFGIYNTARNVRYENGSITYDELPEFQGKENYQVRIGTFKNGVTTWGAWQQFPSTPAEVATPLALTRPYSSSGNTGYRYEADLSKFDYVKAVVDPTVEWYCSWGNPDSQKQDFPKDGIFRFKPGHTYLQLRPAVSKTAKPISVTGYKSGATQSRVLPVKLAPGMYYLEIQNVKGGYSIKSNQITVK